MLFLRTRREILMSGLAAGSLTAVGCQKPLRFGSVGPVVPLPDAQTIRRDYQRMVNFGPRLPGNDNHLRYVSSLVNRFQEIGLEVGPCEEYKYQHWNPKSFGLTVGEGAFAQAIANTAYYVRSESTGADGVTGPLVHAGNFKPVPGFVPGSGRRVPVPELGEIPQGSIVILDAKLPGFSIRQRGGLEYLHAPEELKADYEDRIYRRLWLTPPYPLETLRDAGAAAVVIVMDVSSEMIGGNFSPHGSRYSSTSQTIPALFVGEDTGARLKSLAANGTEATLTLDAEWVQSRCPQVTATLKGTIDKNIIINTHTDGQNFIEENGCEAMLHLASHFASLPEAARLKHNLVFAAWPGHMSGQLPQISGWMQSHADLVSQCAAAITLEHLGAQEWEDVPGRGYVYTGRNEYTNFATTGGLLTQMVKQGLQNYNLDYHGIEAAPGTTIGNVFHLSGVPHVGVIAGPNYLLGIAENGHMDKLDAELAATQTRMVADLIMKIDRAPEGALKDNAKTFGAKPVTGSPIGMMSQCSF